MALNPTTPGVYIQEIPVLPASIAPVATAIPAFVGYTEITSATVVPVRITSLLEFEQKFGGPDKSGTLTATVSGSTVTLSTLPTDVPEFNLYYSVLHYYMNGGGPCYIVSIGDYSAGITAADFDAVGFAALEQADEPTLVLYPDAFSLDTSDYGGVVAAALAHCNKLQDRFTIGDVVIRGVGEDLDSFRASLGMNYLKYGAIYHPSLQTSISYQYLEANITVAGDATGTLAAVKSSNVGVYNKVVAALTTGYRVILPASPAMAGIYAAVDRDRGVWKAPANVSVAGVVAPMEFISAQDQGDLYNVDPVAGKSIDIIRNFTGKGTLVWGARTLAGNDNEWRYINVRRLFIMAEESIKKATEFVVFEPNDANTWVRTKTMIINFLTNLWRDGALVGAKPEQAFFVKVGLGETMTAQDILEGKLIIQIGMAASRPAEFIILQFMHKLQEN